MDDEDANFSEQLDPVRDPKLTPWVAFAIVALILGVVGAVLARAASVDTGAHGAAWGDLIAGTVGTAASIASTALFFGALVMQRQELRNQRAELAAQRDEMRLTRAVHERQMEVAREQARESAAAARFSQALELLRLRLEMEAMSKQGGEATTRRSTPFTQRPPFARPRRLGESSKTRFSSTSTKSSYRVRPDCPILPRLRLCQPRRPSSWTERLTTVVA